jgi:hypothetical protein
MERELWTPGQKFSGSTNTEHPIDIIIFCVRLGAHPTAPMA